MKRKKQREKQVDSLLEAALQQVSSSLEASRKILGSFSQNRGSFEDQVLPDVPKLSDQ